MGAFLFKGVLVPPSISGGAAAPGGSPCGQSRETGEAEPSRESGGQASSLAPPAVPAVTNPFREFNLKVRFSQILQMLKVRTGLVLTFCGSNSYLGRLVTV